MGYRNDGQGEANILQNQFTAYLVTAIRWTKIAYLKERTKKGDHEFPTDFENVFTQATETRENNDASLEQSVLDNITLAQALAQINGREQYILLARVLEGRSFEDLALELGLGYKGAAALYYRTIRKLLKKM